MKNIKGIDIKEQVFWGENKQESCKVTLGLCNVLRELYLTTVMQHGNPLPICLRQRLEARKQTAGSAGRLLLQFRQLPDKNLRDIWRNIWNFS